SQRHSLALPDGFAVGENPQALRPSDHLLQPLRSLAQGGCAGSTAGGNLQSLGWRHHHDRRNLCPCSPARGPGKNGLSTMAAWVVSVGWGSLARSTRSSTRKPSVTLCLTGG